MFVYLIHWTFLIVIYNHNPFISSVIINHLKIENSSGHRCLLVQFEKFPPVPLVKTPLLFCISRSTSMRSCSLLVSFSPLSASPTLFPTMKRFAFCAIRPSTQGQHPRGHINSTVRTMPPSCQLPSASIPTRERERREERDSGRARGWDSLEKKRKGGERREK